MKMCLKFRDCLYAQIDVTLNGCVDDVNLLWFLNSLFIDLLTCTTEV